MQHPRPFALASIVRRVRGVSKRILKRVKHVMTGVLADSIRIVRRRTHRYRFSRAIESVTHVVRHGLQLIDLQTYLVENDHVVSRASGALEARVSLQVETVRMRIRDAAVDHRAWPAIEVSRGVLGRGGVELDMMPFAHDDSCQLR